MFFFSEGFTFRNFLIDAFSIFAFVVWFWLLFTVGADLFRRRDISGWGKAVWVIAWLVIPMFAILAYLMLQGRGMGERAAQRNTEARDELRHVVGFSAADELAKLADLRNNGTISEAEYARMRTRLIEARQ